MIEEDPYDVFGASSFNYLNSSYSEKRVSKVNSEKKHNRKSILSHKRKQNNVPVAMNITPIEIHDTINIDPPKTVDRSKNVVDLLHSKEKQDLINDDEQQHKQTPQKIERLNNVNEISMEIDKKRNTKTGSTFIDYYLDNY
jgi:hypothetical protein